MGSAFILALTLRELGQHERARQLSEDTLIRCRRVLGDDHLHTLLSVATHLAATQREMGHYERACQLAEDTLIRCRLTLGDNHPHTLHTAHNLAAARASLGERDLGR